jgi:Tol biopolymer transport system component
MFCTACASQNPDTLPRCGTCGAPLRHGTTINRATPSGMRRDVQRHAGDRLRIVLSTLAIFVLFVVGGFVIRAYRADQSERSQAYERATASLAAGDYAAAISAFAEAGEYKDAGAQRVSAIATIEPVRSAYLTGVDAFATGNYELAISALNKVVRDVPRYEDAADLLDRARDARTQQLLDELETAELNRDWLRAERALMLLLNDDPTNAELLTRYSALARTHSPMVFARDGAIVSISPDLFDEQLVTDDVKGSWPVWSPDRSKIAFIGSNGEQTPTYSLYIVNPDGTELELLAADVRPEGWPAWSPDGTSIAFTSIGSFELDGEQGISSLHVVEIAAGTERDYTSGMFHFAGSPSWSPDGARIAFVAKDVEQRGPALGRSIKGSVQLLNVQTGAIAELERSAFSSAVFVTWSPVGDYLLVLSSDVGSGWYETQLTSISLVEIGSGAVTSVARRSMAASYPVWSPDGTQFAFAEANDVIQVRSMKGAIRWINVPRDITPFLSWSPDGSALFAPSNDPARASMIVPLDGGDPADVPIVFSQAGPPRWSPVNPDR